MLRTHDAIWVLPLWTCALNSKGECLISPTISKWKKEACKHAYLCTTCPQAVQIQPHSHVLYIYLQTACSSVVYDLAYVSSPPNVPTRLERSSYVQPRLQQLVVTPQELAVIVARLNSQPVKEVETNSISSHAKAVKLTYQKNATSGFNEVYLPVKRVWLCSSCVHTKQTGMLESLLAWLLACLMIIACALTVKTNCMLHILGTIQSTHLNARMATTQQICGLLL